MYLSKIVIFLLIFAVVASKKAHRRRNEKKHLLKELKEEKDVIDILQDDEKDEEKRLLVKENLLEKFDNDNGGYREDPCSKHKCGPGKECEIDDEGKAQCECVKKCPEQDDMRRKVCSNHNETWDSDCEIYKMRCLCTEGLEGCTKKKYEHAHINYFGACKDIGVCGEAELEDFPRRMRDWLFNVMQEMARRDELTAPVLQLEKEAEGTNSRKWVNAVIWKFCDLDVHPHDRHVSRHELFPIRAPLLAMEHCIAPFLDSCDVDDDHKITLREWGDCLGLKDDEIQDKCATMQKGH